MSQIWWILPGARARLTIANFEIANWLGEKGIHTHAQHIGGGFHHPFGYLKLTQALHGSSLPDFAYGGNPCGFLLTTQDGKKVYLACDTGLFGDMRLIGEEGVLWLCCQSVITSPWVRMMLSGLSS